SVKPVPQAVSPQARQITGVATPPVRTIHPAGSPRRRHRCASPPAELALPEHPAFFLPSSPPTLFHTSVGTIRPPTWTTVSSPSSTPTTCRSPTSSPG